MNETRVWETSHPVCDTLGARDPLSVESTNLTRGGSKAMQRTFNSGSRHLALLVALLLGVAPAASVYAHAAPSAVGAVRVATVFIGKGAVVQPLQVRLTPIDGVGRSVEAELSADGSVEIEGLEPGHYLVSAVAPEGFLLTVAPFIEVSDSSLTRVELAFTPAQEPGWWDNADKCEVDSTDGDTLDLDDGPTLTVSSSTEWSGELGSVAAIQQALNRGQNVCVAFVGVEQGDGVAVTSIFATTCTDQGDPVPARDIDNYDCDDDGGFALFGGNTAGLLAGLAGAAGVILGVLEAIEDRPGGFEVITQ